MINVIYSLMNYNYKIDTIHEKLYTIADLKKYILTIIENIYYNNIKLVYNDKTLDDHYLLQNNEKLYLVIVPIKCNKHELVNNKILIENNKDDDWDYVSNTNHDSML